MLNFSSLPDILYNKQVLRKMHASYALTKLMKTNDKIKSEEKYKN